VPIAVTWSLCATGVISSLWLSVLLALALAIGAALTGRALWERWRASGDPLFSELLLWAWLRRVRAERQLANAVTLLGLTATDSEPLPRRAASRERASQLLAQLAAAVEARNPHLKGHSRRVARRAETIARAMSLPAVQIRKIRGAAELHDIGDLRVPAEILDKPEPLTSGEFELVKRHANQGAAIVASIGDPEITVMVRHHHERYDGTGYPAGLLAADIPVGARIIAVAETFDAITAPRPYRPATPKKWALAMLLNASGGQLDPAVVAAFRHSHSRRRAAAVWSLPAISSQRLFAWLRGRRSAAADVSLAGMLAVVALITTMGNILIDSLSGAARAKERLQHVQTARARKAPPMPLRLKTSTHAPAAVVTRRHRPAAYTSRTLRGLPNSVTPRRSATFSSRPISKGGSPGRTGRPGSGVRRRVGSGGTRPGGTGVTGTGGTGVGGGPTGTPGGWTTGGTTVPAVGPGANPPPKAPGVQGGGGHGNSR
jgi:hypothetical protein